jgi:thiol-disulfide isomerase/thioredoxin
VTKLSQHRVLISGIVSPLAALFLYVLVYATLTRFSADLEKDWLFRLSLSTLAMIVPFLVTLALAIEDSRGHVFSRSGKVGLAIAILSLGLAWKPVSDGILRSKQSRNLAMRDVAAPPFNTPDLLGKTQRLGDQKGKVVLVNIWATWCGPCREEMPKLDRLYRKREHQGFIVFGLSDESLDVQRKFVEQVPVSYTLLTLRGGSSQSLSRHRALPGDFSYRSTGTTAACTGPGPAFREG